MNISKLVLQDKLNLFEISILVQLDKYRSQFVRIEELCDDKMNQYYIRKYIFDLVKRGYVIKRYSKFRINDCVVN